MRLVHAHNRRRRATRALGVVAIVLGALAVQFFRVQMLQSNDYMLQSESNRLRPLPVAALEIPSAGYPARPGSPSQRDGCWRSSFAG